MKPPAYEFSLVQCLVFAYVNPANHVSGVQIGHSMG